jgi:hypothetical protein
VQDAVHQPVAAQQRGRERVTVERQRQLAGQTGLVQDERAPGQAGLLAGVGQVVVQEGLDPAVRSAQPVGEPAAQFPLPGEDRTGQPGRLRFLETGREGQAEPVTGGDARRVQIGPGRRRVPGPRPTYDLGMPLLPLSADLWIPIAVMAVGFVLCFMGHSAMRLVFAVLGGFFGWQLGMLLGALIHIDPAWDTVALWGGAVLGAILLGTLAYSFYVAGVMLAVGYLGWALGVWLSSTLGVFGWYARPRQGREGALLLSRRMAEPDAR